MALFTWHLVLQLRWLRDDLSDVLFSILSHVIPIFMIGFVSRISITCPTISRCICFFVVFVFEIASMPRDDLLI